MTQVIKAWGPIPSRFLSRFCIRQKLLVSRLGSINTGRKFDFSPKQVVGLVIQIVSSLFVSWLALNIFADYGPMKYTSSHGVRYSHSDWALQGVNLFNYAFMGILICGLILVKFCVCLSILKKQFLKLGFRFYILSLVIFAIAIFWVYFQLDIGVIPYNLFIPSSLHFNISFVIVSSLLFLGVDSFRIIKFTK